MDDTGWKAGLEDVIAARSAVCAIDGAAGRLFYRGYEIGELAGVVPFEEVTALLWTFAFLVRWLAMLVGWLIFRLLLLVGFFKIEKVQVEVEKLIV